MTTDPVFHKDYFPKIYVCEILYENRVNIVTIMVTTDHIIDHVIDNFYENLMVPIL